MLSYCETIVNGLINCCNKMIVYLIEVSLHCSIEFISNDCCFFELRIFEDTTDDGS